MTDSEIDMTEKDEKDNWLSAVFAAAAGPVIDIAFVDRILARIRKRQRVRLFVIGGAIATATTLTITLTVGQISGLNGIVPEFGTATLSAPSWLTASPYAPLAVAFIFVGLTAWMFTEEA